MKKWLIALWVVTLTGTVFGQTRPRNPFVFRTAIWEGSNPTVQGDRLVAVLLNANFTALYSTVKGGLYMTRTGTAQDGNVTYNHVHDGSVLKFSGGAVLHRNDPTNSVWDLQNGTTAVASQTVYRGFTLSGGTTPNMVAIRYAIIAGANSIQISETPEYVSGGSGGIRRSFTISGIPSGHSIRLRLSGQVSGTETWTAQSGGTVAGGFFTVTTNGNAVLNGTW